MNGFPKRQAGIDPSRCHNKLKKRKVFQIRSRYVFVRKFFKSSLLGTVQYQALYVSTLFESLIEP